MSTCTTRGARLAASIGTHGLYAIYADDLDRMMDLYLPASPATLRAKLHEASGSSTYDDLTSVTELLMVLAEYEGRSADLRDSRADERTRDGFQFGAETGRWVRDDDDAGPTEEQVNDWNIATGHQGGD